jgi:hypothetical protein
MGLNIRGHFHFKVSRMVDRNVEIYLIINDNHCKLEK